MKSVLAIALSLAISSASAQELPLDLSPELECLTVALYHETRGSTFDGMLSVATVIMNRVNSKKYPNTICEVVHQPHQFSYVGHGKPETYLDILDAAKKNPRIYDTEYLEHSINIAHQAFSEIDLPFGKDVLYYHTEDVSPYWNKELSMVKTIDNHIFWSL